MRRPENGPGLKLNMGSGTMIKDPGRGWVNFDTAVHRRGEISTNVLGKIEALPFKDSSFQVVLSSHVIEHFYVEDAIKKLEIMLRVLVPGGCAVVEGPCVLGGYWYYWKKNKNLTKLIEMLYPTRNRHKYGEGWFHRSGWTGPVLAEAMEGVGYTIQHVGPGLTHGFGKRDFRVEGIK